ncbi:hypothetical protein SAMD00019534_066370 [Acytostelium subglobosum LB1]|uniref:hypothetical protein n=1 Tax=Acytostelium subglobosum LB1 TaxID=1410327 RepID=UPI0006449F38|nr:hypothetical protein SAMD00019534_066370 [Acytostelium subglobosum LB1]GAM23462.1 hypothetical protein SAMD00019534_066370 [Acytostelium subglobosum LB1]|eukprot:XP_012753911.1 hypothetical protein SAMD00019534_066370 [Acytostelium subglobosum LB1]
MTLVDSNHLVIFFGADVVLSGNLVYYFSGSSGTLDLNTNWNPIYVTGITSAPTQGGMVTVQGAFLNTTTTETKNTLFIANYVNDTGAEANSDYFSNYFILPASDQISGTNNQANITCIQNSASFTYSFLPPYVTSLTYSSSNIVINGGSFGTKLGDVKAYLDGIQLPVSEITTPHLKITTGYPTGTSLPFDSSFFSYAGVKSLTMSVNQDMKQPYFHTIRPVPTSVTSVASDLGGLVTLSGDTFTQTRWNGSLTTVSIKIGGTSCDNVTPVSKNGNQFSCLMQPSSSTSQQINNLPVSIMIDGAASSGDNKVTFSYDIPDIQLEAEQRGDQVRLVGQRLGNVNNLNQTIITFDSQNLVASSIVFLTTSTLEPNGQDKRVQELNFTIPPTTPIGMPLTIGLIFNGNQSPQTKSIMVYPQVLYVTSPPVAGGLVTIKGTLFQAKQENITIPQCESFTLINSTDITCQLPLGSGGNHTMNITLNTISVVTSFNYQPPVVREITNFSSSGGGVTVYGDNFATADDLSVTIGSVKCRDPHILTSSMLACQVLNTDLPSPLPTEIQTVTVTVAGQTCEANIFGYIIPNQSNDISKQLKWILPFGILAVLFIVGTFTVLTIRLIIRRRRVQAVKKFIKA